MLKYHHFPTSIYAWMISLFLLLQPGFAISQPSQITDLSLGGGYTMPLPPSKKIVTLFSNQSELKLPRGGLDCGKIDWKIQFTNAFDLNLDFDGIATAFIGGAIKYATASLMPTWYETLEQTIKTANAKIQMAKADCASVAAGLEAYRPSDDLKKDIYGDDVGKLMEAGGDTTVSDALKKAGSMQYNLDTNKMIDGLNIEPKTKALMKGLLGQITIHSGGECQKNTDGSLVDPACVDTSSADDSVKVPVIQMGKMEHVFEIIYHVVFNYIEYRINYGLQVHKDGEDPRLPIGDSETLVCKELYNIKEPKTAINTYRTHNRLSTITFDVPVTKTDTPEVVLKKETFAIAVEGLSLINNKLVPAVSCPNIQDMESYTWQNKMTVASVVASLLTEEAMLLASIKLDKGIKNLSLAGKTGDSKKVAKLLQKKAKLMRKEIENVIKKMKNERTARMIGLASVQVNNDFKKDAGATLLQNDLDNANILMTPIPAHGGGRR